MCSKLLHPPTPTPGLAQFLDSRPCQGPWQHGGEGSLCMKPREPATPATLTARASPAASATPTAPATPATSAGPASLEQGQGLRPETAGAHQRHMKRGTLEMKPHVRRSFHWLQTHAAVGLVDHAAPPVCIPETSERCGKTTEATPERLQTTGTDGSGRVQMAAADPSVENRTLFQRLHCWSMAVSMAVSTRVSHCI